MFEKPETKMILIRLVIIAIIGLLIGAVFTTVDNFLKDDLGKKNVDTNSIDQIDDPDQLKGVSSDITGKIQAIKVLDFLKTPIIILIALIIWFSVIVTILRIYWGQDELITGIKTPSAIIIVGAFLEQLSLGKLSVFNTALGNIDPIIITVGSIILIFGFVIMFYNILRYVWVKI